MITPTPGNDVELSMLLKQRHFRNFHSDMITHEDKWALLYSEFSRYRSVAGRHSFGLYLSMLANQGHFRSVWSTLREMQALHTPILQASCEKLLLSTLNGGNTTGDKEGFLAARRFHIEHSNKMSLRTYQTLFQGIRLRHRAWRKASKDDLIARDVSGFLLKIMLKEDNIRPDEKCWVTLLETRSDAAQGLMYWDRMQGAGVPPSLALYTALLRCCLYRGEVKAGKRIVQQAVDGGFTPDRHMYTVLLSLYKQDGSKASCAQMLLLFNLMMEKDMVTSSAVTVLIGAAMVETTTELVVAAKRGVGVLARRGDVDRACADNFAHLMMKDGDLVALAKLKVYCKRYDIRSRSLDAFEEATRGFRVAKEPQRCLPRELQRKGGGNGKPASVHSSRVDAIPDFTPHTATRKRTASTVNLNADGPDPRIFPPFKPAGKRGEAGGGGGGGGGNVQKEKSAPAPTW